MGLLEKFRRADPPLQIDTHIAFEAGAVVRQWNDFTLRTVTGSRAGMVDCVWFDNQKHYQTSSFLCDELRLVAAPDPSAIAHLPAANVQLRSGGPILKVLRCNPLSRDGDAYLRWEHGSDFSRELHVPVQALVAADR